MFISIQLPFLDSRSFVSSNTGRLATPAWPIPNAKKDFVRRFGAVRRRLRGGVDDWQGEDHYCEAVNAIRLPQSNSTLKLNDRLAVRSRFVFRRLLKGSDSLVRAEMGIRLRLVGGGNLNGSDIVSILQWTLKQKVHIHRQNASCIVESGSILASLYLHATSQNSRKCDPSGLPSWWVSSGDPTIFLEFNLKEVINLPRHAFAVEHPEILAAGLACYHLKLMLNQQEFGCWLVGAPERLTMQQQCVLRQLRINLFRLHAELEGVKQVFRLVKQQKITLLRGEIACENVQKYLNESIKLLSKKSQNGLPQSGLLTVALGARDVVNQKERQTVVDLLKDIRKNVLKKVRGFIETPASRHSPPIYNITAKKVSIVGASNMNKQSIRIDGSTIHGDVSQIAAKMIRDSWNQAGDNSTPVDLQKQLQLLASATEEMCKRLPTSEQEKIGRDLRNLTEEALSKQPRKEWFNLSSKGLVDAAKALGEVASPVLQVVKDLSNLLWSTD